jgi:predicted transcriptional regulator
MKTISLKIPDGLAARLEAAAARRSTTKSLVIREALESHLRDAGARTTVGRLAGDLAGCVAGPRDLSTNAEHLEGLGE